MKGDVIRTTVIGCVITTVVVLVAVTGIIMMGSASRKADETATLNEAKTIVTDAQSNLQLQPSDSVIDKMVSANANIVVEKGAAGTAIKAPTTNGTTIGGSGTSSSASSASGNSATGTDTATGTSSGASGDVTQNSDASVSTHQTTDSTTDGTAYGSGIVVTSTGDIMTSYHVIENAKKITVSIDGTDYDATVTGTDPSSDIATIKVDAKNLQVTQIGDSSAVTRGEWVMAVGNPYGMSDSVSTGSVSALGRNIKYVDGSTDVMYANMIQTDASITQGNSGGGLYDSQGKLVGMATIVTTDSGSSTGIGYAIPVNYLVSIANNLLQGKAPSHAVLGVALADVTNDDVTRYGLDSSDGATVTNVTPSGPADNVSIVKGDIITSIDGENVKNAEDLMFKTRSKSINQVVQVDVLRNGKKMEFSVKLGSDV